MDSIKLYVFPPPQFLFCIYTTIIWLPSKIWILFEIHTETLGEKKQSFLMTPHNHWLLPLYIIESLKYNYMQFCSIFRYIQCHPPPGKWVPYGQTVEGGYKHSSFFTGIWWNFIRIVWINAAIIKYTVLYENVVIYRYWWYTFNRALPYLQVSGVIYLYEVTYKVYLLQGQPSLLHLYINTRNIKFCNEYIICYW